MDVRLITPQGMERHESDQIGSLLDGLGLLWIDVAYWDAWTEEKLVKLLGLDPRAARDCAVRNPLPKAHIYPEQVFVVVHGRAGGSRARALRRAEPVRRTELGDHRAWADEPGGAVGRSVCGDRGDHPPTGGRTVVPEPTRRAIRGAGRHADRQTARL